MRRREQRHRGENNGEGRMAKGSAPWREIKT